MKQLLFSLLIPFNLLCQTQPAPPPAAAPLARRRGLRGLPAARFRRRALAVRRLSGRRPHPLLGAGFVRAGSGVSPRVDRRRGIDRLGGGLLGPAFLAAQPRRRGRGAGQAPLVVSAPDPAVLVGVRRTPWR